MSEGSLLVKILGGAVTFVVLPIFIVIALIFASLSGVAEADTCQPAATETEPSYTSPVAAQTPTMSFEQSGLQQMVTFAAGSPEDVHAMTAGKVVGVSGRTVTIEHDDPGSETGGGNGGAKLRATYGLLSTV